MRRLVPALIAILTAAYAVQSPADPGRIIPTAEFRDADFREVFKVIRHESGSSMWLNCPRETLDSLPRLNLSFTHIPARELLRYACIAAGLHFDITAEGVMVAEKHPRMNTEFHRVDIIGGDPNPEKLRDYFASGGMEFPENSSINYNRSTNTITASNTIENLRRLRLIIGSPHPKRRYPIIDLRRSGYVIDNPVISQKLNTIVVDSLSFDNIPMDELLLELHRRSVALDPEKTGVNFFLEPTPNPRRLTVNFTRATLMDILHSLCKAAGLVFQYDDFAVVLRPPRPVSTQSLAEQNHPSQEKKNEPFGKSDPDAPFKQ